INLYEKDAQGNSLGSATLCGIASGENFTGQRTRQIKNVISYGFDINYPMADGSTFMFTLVNTARLPIIKNVIKMGVNLDAKNNAGRTILSDIITDSSALVKTLITPNTDFSV